MLAFDLYVVLGLIALVVLAITAALLLLLVLVVQAGVSALWRRLIGRTANRRGSDLT